jgi:hypothetical protein
MLNRRALKLAECLLYVFCAICLFQFVYVFASDLQDFSHLWKMLPTYLSFLLPTYVLFVIRFLLAPVSENALKKTLFVNGIVLCVLSVATLGLIIVGFAQKSYSSIVQGGATPLYPLDLIILNGVLCGLSVFWILSSRHSWSALVYSEQRGVRWPRKLLLGAIKGLFVLISLYFLGAFLCGLAFADYGGAYQGYMIPVYCLMLLPAGCLAVYEWFVQKGMPLNQAKRKGLFYSTSALGLSVLLSFLFLLFLKIQPDFLIEEATAYFPVDFMGSYAIAPFLLCITPTIASLTALISVLRMAPSMAKK